MKIMEGFSVPPLYLPPHPQGEEVEEEVEEKYREADNKNWETIGRSKRRSECFESRKGETLPVGLVVVMQHQVQKG